MSQNGQTNFKSLGYYALKGWSWQLDSLHRVSNLAGTRKFVIKKMFLLKQHWNYEEW